MNSSHKSMCVHILVLGMLVFGIGLTVTHVVSDTSDLGLENVQLVSLGMNTIQNGDSVGKKEGRPPPKVALLYLTRHGLKAMEPIWTDWLLSCPIDTDLLFDIHVHISDSPQKLERTSVFYKKELPKMTTVQWGNHSMVDAERLLFAAAMENELVQTFVLLSEDSVPLYPALLIYMQLTVEPKSRINVCRDDEDTTGNDRMDHRWVPRMADAGVTKGLWRKSSQWVSLKRDHVSIILNDIDVNKVFAEECYVAPERFCVSDEHYIPSLLALKDQRDRCTCDGMAMMTRWTNGAAHPNIFRAEDAKDQVITEELMDGWNPNTKCGTVRSAFLDMWADGRVSLVSHQDHEEAAWRVLLWEEDEGNHLMTPNCPLFARKIAQDDDAVLAWKQALAPYLA